MSEQRSLITVVGDNNQVDLAVPSNAPIAEYADMLARLCDQSGDDTLPPVWSLALAGSTPLPLTASLATASILDGETLYLRDTLAAEDDEPIVRSVWELVTESGQDGRGPRWNALARGRAAVLLGAVWLTAGLCYLAATGHAGLGAGLLAGVVGLGMAAVARLFQPHRRVLPHAMRVALACTAIPCLALSGMLSLGTIRVDPTHLVFGGVGCAIGFAVALLAAPDIAVAAVGLLFVIAGAIGALCLLLDASRSAAAGTVVVTGTLFLAICPRAAGLLTAASWLRLSAASVEPDADPDAISGQVTRAHRALVLLVTLTCGAIGAALLVLSDDSGPFPLLLVGCAALALALRSGTFEFVSEAVPPLIAALLGALGLLHALDHWHTTQALPLPILLVVGGAAIGIGLPTVLWRSGGRQPTDPPRRLGALLTLCQIAMPALLLGTYGAFTALWNLGTKF